MGDSSRRPSHGREPPAGNNDWRVDFNPDIRRMRVNFIVNDFAGPGSLPNREAYTQLKESIEKLEEKIFAEAPSMHYYLMKTSGWMAFFAPDEVLPKSVQNLPRFVGCDISSPGMPRPFGSAQTYVPTVASSVPNLSEDTATSGSVPRHSNTQFNVRANSQRQMVGNQQQVIISQQQQRVPQQYLGNVNHDPGVRNTSHHRQLEAVRLEQRPVYVQSRQQPNPPQQNMPRRLQAPDQNSGLLLQRPNVINQQNQVQRATLGASSSIPGDLRGGDWQEAIYQRITQMKDRYLHNICGIYWQRAGKSLQPESEYPQELRRRLERFLRLLVVEKPDIVSMNKETLDKHERQIVLIINALCPGKACSQVQGPKPAPTPIRGQPEISQASSSDTPSTQQQQNHPVVNSLRGNAVVATEQPFDRLTRAVNLVSPKDLSDSLRSIGSVVNAGDRNAGSAPGLGSRAAVGADLAADTMHHNSLQNYDGTRKMKRSISATTPINADVLSANITSVFPDDSNQSGGPESCEVDSNATSSSSKRPRLQEGE